MKKRIYAVLLTLSMLLAMLPVSALAAQEDGADSGTVCTGTADCTAEEHSESCPLYVVPNEDNSEAPAEPTVVEQLQARINALPDADALTDMGEDELAEVNAEVGAIYDAIYELTDLDVAVPS